MKYPCWNFLIKPAPEEGGEEEVELHIVGEIIPDDYADLYEMFGFEATSPRSFTQQLKSYAGKPITVWINLRGGSCDAASLIYTQLKQHTGGVTVKVDGVAASAASVIAMAAEKVYMSPTSVMMIHNPATLAQGDHFEMQRALGVLVATKESIINAYQLKTGLDRDTIADLMDGEKWMDANEAIKLKFADGMLYDAAPVSPVAVNSIVDAQRAVYACLRGQASAQGKIESEKAKAVFDFEKIKHRIGGSKHD